MPTFNDLGSNSNTNLKINISDEMDAIHVHNMIPSQNSILFDCINCAHKGNANKAFKIKLLTQCNNEKLVYTKNIKTILSELYSNNADYFIN